PTTFSRSWPSLTSTVRSSAAPASTSKPSRTSSSRAAVRPSATFHAGRVYPRRHSENPLLYNQRFRIENSFMYYILITLFVLVCLVLSLVILLQQGRGGDIASAFGGSSSQAAFGARSGATLLTKATTICAALFMLLALALSIIGQRGTASVVS